MLISEGQNDQLKDLYSVSKSECYQLTRIFMFLRQALNTIHKLSAELH